MRQAKQLLRTWIEGRIANLPQEFDPAEVQVQLNAALRAQGLFREYAETDPMTGNLLGQMGPLRVALQYPLAVVQTRFGIQACGHDDSVYVYRRQEDRWTLVLKVEEENYLEDRYRPQVLHSVLVSPYTANNEYYLLALGRFPWCTSVFHSVFYRLFRLAPTSDPVAVVDRREPANISSVNPIRAGFRYDGVVIEFDTPTADGFVRTAVREYDLTGPAPKRTGVPALAPRPFAEEWAMNPWELAETWSEPDHRAALSRWHRNLAGKVNCLSVPVKRCDAAELYQVSCEREPSGSGDVHFLVRWRPPFRFMLMRVSPEPFPVARSRIPKRARPTR